LCVGKNHTEGGKIRYFYIQAVDFKDNNNVFWIHVIRVAAIVCVTFLHCVVRRPLKLDSGILVFNWWLANVYIVTLTVGAPLFFMLSGCILLRKDDSIPTFFRKRVKKVLLPFIVWSVLYRAWKVYYIGTGLTFFGTLLFIGKPAFFHLWFLHVLLGLYLYIPILRIIVLYGENKILYYFLLLWYLNSCLAPLLRQVLQREVFPMLDMFSGYVGYLLLGYLLSDIKVTKKGVYRLLYVLLACVCFAAFGSFAQAFVEPASSRYYFHDDLSISNVVISSIAFLCLRYFSENTKLFKNKIMIKFVERVSAASFGIYLIHPAFLDIAVKWGIFSYMKLASPSTFQLFILLRTILIFLTSFISICILQKIPIIKRCVP